MRGGRFDLVEAAVDSFGNALGNSLVDVMSRPQPKTASEVEEENRVGFARVRQSRIEEVKKLGALPVDSNAMYLEPEQIEQLGEAAKNGKSLLVSPSLRAFIQTAGIDGKVNLVGSSRAGFKSYYDADTVREVVDFLTQLGGGERMPVAVGFALPGANAENAYRSMLDYVGGYVSDETRYRMHTEAASKSTGLFKYSDAGIVDLTRGLQESFAYIDSQLVGKGYITPRGHESYQQALAAGDGTVLSFHARPQYEDTVSRARLHAYHVDDAAPARLRDGAREAAKAETTSILVGAGLELAALAPWGKLGRLFASGAEALAGSASRLGSLLLRSSRVEGELAGALGEVPGKGLLANRKQMRDFFNEAKSMGYSVRIDEAALRASVNPRTKEVILRADRSELSTLVDEYSHMWNKANGRGNFLPDDLAQIHREMAGKGTARFTDVENTLFHQLELANMWYSGFEKLPSFVRAVPRAEIRSFINQTRDVAASLGKL
jgi:large repetitive protein